MTGPHIHLSKDKFSLEWSARVFQVFVKSKMSFDNGQQEASAGPLENTWPLPPYFPETWRGSHTNHEQTDVELDANWI